MSERNDARRKIFTTLLTNAVTSWESIITIALTLILFATVGNFTLFGITIPAVAWLILGGFAETALVLSMFGDPEETQEAMAREFEADHNLGKIRNRVSRDRLQRAMEYRHNMLDIKSKAKSNGMKIRIQDTIEQVNDWISAMYSLAQHIDDFEDNKLIESDYRALPGQIEKVKIRIQQETSEAVRNDLERQLQLLEQQLNNLEATRNSVKRAEIQLETTLSSLGTVYAQMSLLGTQSSLDGSRQQRLSAEIQDEVMSLQDTIQAMEEVQSQTLRIS
ncbi:MAG: hypothetical protein AAFV93_11055 [Chloroflexota bacterium]